MFNYLTPEQVEANVLAETDIEVLRAGLLTANALILALDDSFRELLEEAQELEDENASLFADAERYALVKFTLPSMLEMVGKLGINSPAFGELTAEQLDASLDAAIAHGALDELRAAQEQDELEAAEGSRQDA
jgi:hypothetical protein